MMLEGLSADLLTCSIRSIPPSAVIICSEPLARVCISARVPEAYRSGGKGHMSGSRADRRPGKCPDSPQRQGEEANRSRCLR